MYMKLTKNNKIPIGDTIVCVNGPFLFKAGYGVFFYIWEPDETIIEIDAQYSDIDSRITLLKKSRTSYQIVSANRIYYKIRIIDTDTRYLRRMHSM